MEGLPYLGDPLGKQCPGRHLPGVRAASGWDVQPSLSCHFLNAVNITSENFHGARPTSESRACDEPL